MSLNGNTEEMQRGNLHGKVVSIPLVDKSLTKSGYSADAKATGDALGKKVNTVDIVDNLNSYVNNKPLSAKQGAELKRRIDGIDPHFAENVIYDNENSNLESTEVQGAINELKEISDGIKINYIDKTSKPTGSYTGNGSATSRTITTGGTGGVILIYSNNAGERNICIVTKIGGIAFRISNETVTKYMGQAILFGDGKISIGTADSSVNANGVNYYYQVL